jgi:hypothetical protein
VAAGWVTHRLRLIVKNANSGFRFDDRALSVAPGPVAP